MAETARYTPLASSARTTSGQSAGLELFLYEEAIFFLNVTAVSGTTPTLDVSLDYSPDGTNWFPSGIVFTQITADAMQLKTITTFGRFVRINYVIGGTTPSFTFIMDVVAKNF